MDQHHKHLSVHDFSNIIGVLSVFKYYNDDVINISKKYARQNNIFLTLDMLEQYADILIRTRKISSLMFMFDRIKEDIEQGAYQLDSTLTNEKNVELEKLFKTNKDSNVKHLHKNFLQKLLQNNLAEEASLIYHEISKKGWVESTSDYING